MTIVEHVSRHFPRMAALREQLHKNPELGFALEKTSALIHDELVSLGIEVRTGFAETGLVGILRGNGSGKTVLLRADMDALPIQEETTVPYASQTPGVMHACGHDGHVAALLGAARVLAERRDSFNGNVIFLFQPAEEDPYGGAKRMIDDGVLNILPVDAAFAGHLWGALPAGEIHVKPGVAMPSRDEFFIELRGKGGHGAMPHLTVDPVVMAAQCIMALQTLVSRNVDAYDPAVLSICQLATPPGATNIIPDSVRLGGTLRACSQPVRALLLERMHSVLAGICSACGGSYIYTPAGGVPEMINDPLLTEFAVHTARSVAGKDKVTVRDIPMSGSEDFAYFAKAIPASYVFVGIKEGSDNILHHNSRFQWNHEHMQPLAAFYAAAALDFLAK